MAEVSKPLIPQLMGACHAILSQDSEDSGMIAQFVLFDIHKAHKQTLEEHSGPFFDWLQQVGVWEPWVWVEASAGSAAGHAGSKAGSGSHGGR